MREAVLVSLTEVTNLIEQSQEGRSVQKGDDASFFERNIVLWVIAILLSSALAAAAGYHFVYLLRNHYKKTGIITNLIILVYAAPIVIYMICFILIEFRLLDRVVGSCFSFGTVVGILLKLSSKPSGSRVVRLIVKQVAAKPRDIWLDSLDLTVGEVQSAIADSFAIKPLKRVLLQSGKGSVLEDLKLPFIKQLDDSQKATDFFGYFTCSCYVKVLEQVEEEHNASTGLKFGVSKEESTIFNPFKSLLDSRAKYGDAYTIMARSAASDEATKFHICDVEKSAGAAPGHAPLFVQLKILAWNATDNINEEARSEDASVATIKSKSSGSILSLLWHKQPRDILMKGKPIMHGDSIVIESDSKFMSVSRGWRMAWCSLEPRHSGCFEIEIVQRDRKNFNFSTFSKKLQGVDLENDPGVRPGDYFRLKSVKFPGYELGITSVKLKDEYYSLGLRKIGTSDDAWCMATLFTLHKGVLSSVRGSVLVK